ncbi:MAG: ATP-binding protein [Minwuia sp.]|nr:ATP-binding protein [Minwuia sp.]
MRRHRLLNRLHVGGVAGRLALVLMLLLAIALAITIGWYAKDRADTARRLLDHTARRTEQIVILLDRTTPADRPDLARVISGPTLGVRIRPGPPPGADHDHDLHDDMQRGIRRFVDRNLPALRGRPMVIVPPRDDDDHDHSRHRDDSSGFGRGEQDRAGSMEHPPEPDLLPSRRKLIFATTLKDGTWVHFLVSTDRLAFRWAVRGTFWIGFTCLLIIVFAIWAARRATRPLRELAQAADRLGLDVDAPPLPESGSRELRKTAVAFNRMQTRIKRLIDDRTLMLAALSHDLKTILTRLRLRAEFIDDPDQQHRAVSDIDDMQQMVDQALGFIRGDQATEAIRRIDLAGLLRDLSEDAAAQGGQVSFDGPERLPVDGRPVALKRAVGNLIENALRYGGGEVALSLSKQDGRAILILADNGPGLPETELDKVFQPFYRLETSRNRETGGSGLGLALARDVFRRLGGDLALANRPEGGLAATAWLPIDST